MDLVGLSIAVGALGAATAFGLWRRGTDGRLRSALATAPARAATVTVQPVAPGAVSRAATPKPVDTVPACATASPSVAASPGDGTAPSVAASPGDGTALSPGTDGSTPSAGAVVDPALLAALGGEPADATLLQFSTVFCAPCRATRRICAEVAALLPGVRYLDVDAESHLDAVRALGIWRTPTVLVLDRAGRIVRRATGVPARAQVIAVLVDLLPEHGR